MPDTPFKSMTPDPTSQRRDPYDQPRVRCERCLGWIYEGDWPFCRGAVADHKR